MSHTVKIKNTNYTLFVHDDESVLDAAIRQDFDFPYSCRSATCATCMGKVLKGSVNYGDHEPYALSIDEQEDGFALFCAAIPNADLLIDIEDVYAPEYIPVSTIDYQIDEQALLGNNVHKFCLSPVADKRLRHTAGQYLNIITDDNIPIPFSIANRPEDGVIELHIHDADDFQFTKAILDKAAASQPLRLRGPHGSMIYREQPDLPIIFIAGGTGFVPLKAILEDLFQRGIKREMHLYWGAKTPDQLYLQSLCQQWAKTHPSFHFTPVIEHPDNNWQGKLGLAQDAVLADFADLSGYQVFASGSPEMVYAAKKAFIAQGLHPHFIFSDAFECFPKAE